MDVLCRYSSSNRGKSAFGGLKPAFGEQSIDFYDKMRYD